MCASQCYRFVNQCNINVPDHPHLIWFFVEVYVVVLVLLAWTSLSAALWSFFAFWSCLWSMVPNSKSNTKDIDQDVVFRMTRTATCYYGVETPSLISTENCFTNTPLLLRWRGVMNGDNLCCTSSNVAAGRGLSSEQNYCAALAIAAWRVLIAHPCQYVSAVVYFTAVGNHVLDKYALFGSAFLESKWYVNILY